MFEKMRGIWQETRGNILKDQLTDTLKKLEVSDPRLQLEFQITASSLYDQLNQRLFNMSPEGQVKLGKAYQSRARAHFDLQAGTAYAEWVIGAWLESSHLPGSSATEVSEFLSSFLEGLQGVRRPGTDRFPDQTPRYEEVAIDDEIDSIFGDLQGNESLSAMEQGNPLNARYGWDRENPVVVRSIPDAYLYLSRLQTSDGGSIGSRRAGSKIVKGFESPLDEYIISLNDVEIGSIFIYCYGQNNDNEPPEGLILV